MSKPVLCLDFDGVCHSYTSGWQGADVISDDPVNGLFEFLEQAAKHFDIHIFSGRSHRPGGIAAMRKWFEIHRRVWLDAGGLSQWDDLPLYFPVVKPHVFVMLDDRALPFDGVWPNVDDLRSFKPWHLRGESE